MSSTADKVKGYANQAAGTVRQGVGKVVGSKQLQMKGAAQERKGKAQVTFDDVKEKVRDGANKVADKIKRKL